MVAMMKRGRAPETMAETIPAILARNATIPIRCDATGDSRVLTAAPTALLAM